MRLDNRFDFTINALRWWLQTPDEGFGHIDLERGGPVLENLWLGVPAEYWQLFARPLPSAQSRYLFVMDLIRCVGLAGEYWKKYPVRGRVEPAADVDSEVDAARSHELRWKFGEGELDGQSCGGRREWSAILVDLAQLTSDGFYVHENVRWHHIQYLSLQEVERAFREWQSEGVFNAREPSISGNHFEMRALAEWRWMRLQQFRQTITDALSEHMAHRNRMYVLSVALMWQTLDDWLREDIASLAKASPLARTSEYLALSGDSLENQGFEEDVPAIENRMFMPRWYTNDVRDPSKPIEPATDAPIAATFETTE